MRIYSLICVLTLFSCSANYHYRKAIKKGLEPLISSDTIRIATIDSIPVVRHDTIIYEKYFSSKDTIVVQRAKASKQPNYLLWIFLIVLVLAALQLFKKFI